MDRRAILVHALAFVTARIETEAVRVGEPLTDEQRYLLNNLPTAPAPTPVYQRLRSRVSGSNSCSEGLGLRKAYRVSNGGAEE
jgi:hypothetical protein